MNETDSTLPPLLARITHPSMVADLSLADKQILATELRQTIIRTVAANGGHLAPSLGVVELTLALLSVFDPEEDKLVWDVGHQSYAWKLLTGRSENFHTLRQLEASAVFRKSKKARLIISASDTPRHPFPRLSAWRWLGIWRERKPCARGHRRRLPHRRAGL